MLSVSQLFFCAGVVVLGLTSVHGLSDEEKDAITAMVRPFVEECGKEYDVSIEDIKAAKEAGNIHDINPCLISCVLKKMEIFDDKGKFDVEKAKKLASTLLHQNENQEKALSIIETCSSVNDQEVSDGDKGCERAKLALECYGPLKEEFSP